MPTSRRFNDKVQQINDKVHVSKEGFDAMTDHKHLTRSEEVRSEYKYKLMRSHVRGDFAKRTDLLS